MGVARARSFALIATLAILLVHSSSAAAPGARSQAAAIDTHPLRTPVTTIIEFGEQYLGSEQYDAKITVLEVVRGEKAWEMMKQASASNAVPKAGFEYLLARVRFEFAARTSLSHFEYDVEPGQFTATERDGREIEGASIETQPDPALKGKLKSGESVEGWIAFVVPRRTSQPLMVFREDVGDVSHSGGGTWFELYRRAAALRK